jgi:ribosomal protein L24E
MPYSSHISSVVDFDTDKHPPVCVCVCVCVCVRVCACVLLRCQYLYFCTSKAGTTLQTHQQPARLVLSVLGSLVQKYKSTNTDTLDIDKKPPPGCQLLSCQYLYFCTSKASKLSTLDIDRKPPACRRLLILGKARRYSVYLFYWYKSTNTGSRQHGGGVADSTQSSQVLSLLVLLVQKYKYWQSPACRRGC